MKQKFGVETVILFYLLLTENTMSTRLDTVGYTNKRALISFTKKANAK